METEELEKSLYSCVGRQQSGEQELTNKDQQSIYRYNRCGNADGHGHPITPVSSEFLYPRHPCFSYPRCVRSG